MEKFEIFMLFFAKEDANEIAKYYENLSIGLGDKFYHQFRNTIEKLKINPFYEIKYNEIRVIPLEKFPYKVLFRVNEKEKIVFVEAVISDKQDPFTNKIKI